ncbi:uncharacterized protein LOC133181530 [Saccostrea echinata]|uniref:uncharacterized protein LOC133181530 n=1 Tax=Saccostrea echinata TaxID=191078 RepID=UPI002A7F4E16|nr:uncharacterized protein LOC133181530 [Saccostrea echinata]
MGSHMVLTTLEACNREPFQRPNYYIIYIHGYALLRLCPTERYYIPQLCRCVPLRLPVSAPSGQPKADIRPERRSPTTFLPVTIEERPHSTPLVTTVNPLVTNSFDLLGGGFNPQDTDTKLSKSSKRKTSRHLLQHQTNLSNPSTKSSTKTSFMLSSKASTKKERRVQSPPFKKNKGVTKIRNTRKPSELKQTHISDVHDKKHEKLCNPYFTFVFDKTFLSVDKSMPSFPSNTIRFLREPGSTGQTSAYLDGDGIVTVWGMSYITFAVTFKFLVRFKLSRNYPYEDKFYSLISDGPCEESIPQYSISVNPVRREIRSFMALRKNDVMELLLTDVDLTDWITVSLQAKDGEIALFTDKRQATGEIGASTFKSFCPMEIGKKYQPYQGFIGYIDMVQFHNCF